MTEPEPDFAPITIHVATDLVTGCAPGNDGRKRGGMSFEHEEARRYALRTPEQLRAIVAGNPLAKEALEPAHLCVTFLSHAPTLAELSSLHAKSWAPERVEIVGHEIYTWHPNGQGRSPLAAAIGKLPLRGAVTTRNWNTVTKLHRMLEDPRGRDA